MAVSEMVSSSFSGEYNICSKDYSKTRFSLLCQWSVTESSGLL